MTNPTKRFAVRMTFTGHRLELLRSALHRAIEAVDFEIGSHPAPNDYPDDIDELKQERFKYESMLIRLNQTEFRALKGN